MEDDINPEILISLVENRSILWDKTCEQYKNKIGKLEAWREICSIIKPDFVDLNEQEKFNFCKLVTTKWTNIKDGFNRAERKEKEGRRFGSKSVKPYIYKPQLKFLAKLSEPESMPESFNTPEQDNKPIPSAPLTHPMSIPSTSKRLKIDKSKFLDIQLRRDIKNESPHMSFFKGILPSISTFNEDETLELQADILATIQRIRKKRRDTNYAVDYYRYFSRKQEFHVPVPAELTHTRVTSPGSPALTDMTNSTQDSFNFEEKSSQSSKEPDATMEVHIKDEPAEWDTKSIEDADQSIAEMFHSEMSVKPEPSDDADSEDESLIYSPLACELCAEVFTVPAAWVRHVQGHSNYDQNSRKRKLRSSGSDDDSVVLLRCDLCQKHFLNPAEWVRHIQNTHTETELANANKSAPPKRHNRFTEGVQNKTCTHCNKTFPSHASMLIHMRTHTGERPFICGLCNKGFSVKSNLVRHLRTLHDHQESPPRDEPGPSEVKRET
ncbi:uncharacterized protein [Epargyreus clarus]|uniref:uncharacterized protein isoform X3 n=1 Tax=Epargyreus clarus TaxID=520877 RepID=UPI003C2B79D3